MYGKLNITENHLQALSLFTKGFDKEYYIREVERLLKISPRTAQIILDDLEKKAVLESRMRGKIKSYRIKRSDAAIDYLVLVEHYKKISFMEKRLMVKEITAKITPFIHGIGIVFGSYAKGLEKKDSDIDIFIAGKCDKEGVESVAQLYGIEISVKVYPARAFESGLRKDILIKEVLENHVIFLDAEKFVRMVMRNG